jgi:hypothetical protein
MNQQKGGSGIEFLGVIAPFQFNNGTRVTNPYIQYLNRNGIEIQDTYVLDDLFAPSTFITGECAKIIDENDKQIEPNQTQNVIGFYYPGKNDPVDNKYKFPIGGNFYASNIKVTIKGNVFNFTNVEALFQAFKLLFIDYNRHDWATNPAPSLFNVAFKNFENMTGEQAFQAAKPYNQQLPKSWHDIKRNVMYLLLSAKFGYYYGTTDPNTSQNVFVNHLGQQLLNTGNAYLAEYTPNNEEWGFNYRTNKGNNWLGRLLMIKRRELGGVGKPRAPTQDAEMYYYNLIKNEMIGQGSTQSQTTGTGNFPNKEIEWRYNSIRNKLAFKNQGYSISKAYVTRDTSKHVYAIKLNTLITDQSFINHLKNKVADLDIYDKNNTTIIYIKNTPSTNVNVSSRQQFQQPQYQQPQYQQPQYQQPQYQQQQYQQSTLPQNISIDIQNMLNFQNNIPGKNYSIQKITQETGKHRFGVVLNNVITPGFANVLRQKGYDVYPTKSTIIFVR